MRSREHYPWLTYLLGAFGVLSLISCNKPNTAGCIDVGSGNIKCGVSGSANAGSAGGSPTPTQTPSTQSLSNRASLKIGTVWEKTDGPCSASSEPYFEGGATAYDSKACDAVTTFHKTCEVPMSSGPNATITCDVSIPEGQLYFSSVRFEFAENSKECARVVWRPYFYQASNQAGFVPDWLDSSTVDCSQPMDTISTDCFSGPGKKVAPQFPKYVGLYYVFGKRSGIWNALVPNANETSPALTNRWAANNLSESNKYCNPPPQAIPGGDGYVCPFNCDPITGGCRNYQDYAFLCMDEWELMRYKVVVRITDVDDSGIAATIPLEPNQKRSWTEYAQ